MPEPPTQPVPPTESVASLRMRRSLSFLLGAGSLICFMVAYECYNRAVINGKALADAIDGIEFESVRTPTSTKIALALGLMLLVAAITMFAEWWKLRSKNAQGQGKNL